MNLDALARLVTVGLFGAAGWFVILAAVLGLFVRFWLVSGFGFTFYANWAIASCCLGVLVGLTVRSVARTEVGRSTP